MFENLFPSQKNVLEQHLDDVTALIEDRKETLNIFKITKDNLEVINNKLVKKQLDITEIISDLNKLNDNVGAEITSNQTTLRKIEEVFNV